MTELEKLAKEIMAEFEKDGEPVTFTEALEMAQMETNNKQLKRYEKSDKPRKKTERIRKIDHDKKHLLSLLEEKLTTETDAHDFTRKTETEFSFWFNNNYYTTKLIKHRPPK